jgi:hypothetical protein
MDKEIEFAGRVRINGHLIETESAEQLDQIIHRVVFMAGARPMDKGVKEKEKNTNSDKSQKLSKRESTCVACKTVFNPPQNYLQKKTCGQEECATKARSIGMLKSYKKKSYGDGTKTSTKLNDWSTGKSTPSGGGVINTGLGETVSHSVNDDRRNVKSVA